MTERPVWIDKLKQRQKPLSEVGKALFMIVSEEVPGEPVKQGVRIAGYCGDLDLQPTDVFAALESDQQAIARIAEKSKRTS